MTLEKLLADILGTPEDDLTEDTGPENHRGWTSKVHFELVAAIEETFGIRLSRREIREMRSLGQAKALVAAKVGGGLS